MYTWIIEVSNVYLFVACSRRIYRVDQIKKVEKEYNVNQKASFFLVNLVPLTKNLLNQLIFYEKQLFCSPKSNPFDKNRCSKNSCPPSITNVTNLNKCMKEG